MKPYALRVLLLVFVLGWSAPASAHFCNNIFDTLSRIIVRPERSTLFPGLAIGDTATLRVSVRNNFPYVVSDAEMRAIGTDFEVTVTPALQDLHPYERTTFDFQITRISDTGDDDLQLQIRVFAQNEAVHRPDVKVWRDDEQDRWTTETPDEVWLRDIMDGLNQGAQLSAARVADLFSESDGVDRLIELYGRPRLMYNSEGPWGDGQWFPNRPLYRYDFRLLRSGMELAKRHSQDSRVLPAMINAMDDLDVLYRGASALMAAYLGGGGGARARIETMATSDACVNQALCTNFLEPWEPSEDARLMAKSALVLLGDSQYRAEVVAEGLNHSNPRVRMVCAAALGLAGDDNAVIDTLMPLALDSDADGEIYLFGAYLLSLLANDRRGPGGEDCVSFYGEQCEVLPENCTNLIDDDRDGATDCQDDECGPGPEECDGFDNDCNGTADDGLQGAACPLQQGVCADTTEACAGGAGWQPCDRTAYGADYEPAESRCDGLDNDCDGSVDDGLQAPACPLVLGVCQGAIRPCDGVMGWRDCDLSYGPDYESEEISCDDLDNDCDGSIDEAVAGCCVEGLTRPCSRDQGECTAGLQTCDANGSWGACDGVLPTGEECDGLDNDCDGETDELAECQSLDGGLPDGGGDGARVIGNCSSCSSTGLSPGWLIGFLALMATLVRRRRRPI